MDFVELPRGTRIGSVLIALAAVVTIILVPKGLSSVVMLLDVLMQ
jgi:hypothetical protein